MITNFKIFENIFNKNYEPGDYIFIKLNHNIRNPINLFRYARIIKILSQSTYEIDAFIDDKNIISSIHHDRILRKLKPREIKEFELKKDIEKYNL